MPQQSIVGSKLSVSILLDLKSQKLIARFLKWTMGLTVFDRHRGQEIKGKTMSILRIYYRMRGRRSCQKVINWDLMREKYCHFLATP